jgi:hypothetical protein
VAGAGAGAGAQSYNSAGAGAGDEKPEFAQHYKRLGGTGFQGHFWILKRAPKKFFPQMLATEGGGRKIYRHIIPEIARF